MKKRIIITGVLATFYFFNDTYFRPLANAEHWHPFAILFFGSFPSFIGAIGLSILFVAFQKNENKKIQVPIVIGIVMLIKEIVSIHSSNNGHQLGTTFDYYDILAIILGTIIAYYIEREQIITSNS